MISLPSTSRRSRNRSVVCLERPDLPPFGSIADAARWAELPYKTVYEGYRRQGLVDGRFHFVPTKGRRPLKFGFEGKPVLCQYPDGYEQWWPSIKASVEHTKRADGIGLSRRQIEHAIYSKKPRQDGTLWSFDVEAVTRRAA